MLRKTRRWVRILINTYRLWCMMMGANMLQVQDEEYARVHPESVVQDEAMPR